MFYENTFMHSGDRICPQSAYLIIGTIAVTFDLLTSKFDQFNIVPNCTEVGKFGKILPTIL